MNSPACGHKPFDTSDIALGALWLMQCDCGRRMAVQEKELLSGAVVNCGCDGKPYQRYHLAYEDGTTLQLVTAETLCPECRVLN